MARGVNRSRNQLHPVVCVLATPKGSSEEGSAQPAENRLYNPILKSSQQAFRGSILCLSFCLSVHFARSVRSYFRLSVSVRIQFNCVLGVPKN